MNQCNKCLKIFNDKHRLKQHQNRKTSCIINITDINECDKCLKTFTDKHKLKQHQNRKTLCIINKDLFKLQVRKFKNLSFFINY
jgi:hypothetical protein